MTPRLSTAETQFTNSSPPPTETLILKLTEENPSLCLIPTQAVGEYGP